MERHVERFEEVDAAEQLHARAVVIRGGQANQTFGERRLGHHEPRRHRDESLDRATGPGDVTGPGSDFGLGCDPTPVPHVGVLRVERGEGQVRLALFDGQARLDKGDETEPPPVGLRRRVRTFPEFVHESAGFGQITSKGEHPGPNAEDTGRQAGVVGPSSDLQVFVAHGEGVVKGARL